MKEIRWDLLKSERLKRTRGVSFEKILQFKLITVQKHHTKEHQNVMLFERKGYIWVVPYVESTHEIFLETLYPSRKYTKIYQRGELK